MTLRRVKLGELIERSDSRNYDGNCELSDVRGMSIQKEFIETKANMDGVSLASYKIVAPDFFAYVTVTSRNGDKITIAHNDTEDSYLVSSTYEVFRVKDGEQLDSRYLFMHFNRPEFDRYARFNSWGSARETFSWEDLCDIELELPPIEVQRKYVAIYEAMLANQQSYECGLDDLKLMCDGYIEKLMRECKHQRIAPYIAESDERNGGRYGVENVRGISVLKKFIPTKAKMEGVSLAGYKTVDPRSISFVTVTSRNSDKITIAMNDSNEDYLVSATYIVFGCREDKLLPEYLMLFFSRSEFDRYARFNSWGSARETFNWSDMQDVEIPIPEIETQRAIADIYKVYRQRSEINERLKAQLKDLCPILIKGSIDEARAS